MMHACLSLWSVFAGASCAWQWSRVFEARWEIRVAISLVYGLITWNSLRLAYASIGMDPMLAEQDIVEWHPPRAPALSLFLWNLVLSHGPLLSYYTDSAQTIAVRIQALWRTPVETARDIFWLSVLLNAPLSFGWVFPESLHGYAFSFWKYSQQELFRLHTFVRRRNKDVRAHYVNLADNAPLCFPSISKYASGDAVDGPGLRGIGLPRFDTHRPTKPILWRHLDTGPSDPGYDADPGDYWLQGRFDGIYIGKRCDTLCGAAYAREYSLELSWGYVHNAQRIEGAPPINGSVRFRKAKLASCFFELTKTGETVRRTLYDVRLADIHQEYGGELGYSIVGRVCGTVYGRLTRPTKTVVQGGLLGAPAWGRLGRARHVFARLPLKLVGWLPVAKWLQYAPGLVLGSILLILLVLYSRMSRFRALQTAKLAFEYVWERATGLLPELAEPLQTLLKKVLDLRMKRFVRWGPRLVRRIRSLLR